LEIIQTLTVKEQHFITYLEYKLEKTEGTIKNGQSREMLSTVDTQDKGQQKSTHTSDLGNWATDPIRIAGVNPSSGHRGTERNTNNMSPPTNN